MYDIQSGVDFYNKPIITQFNRVILSMRTEKLYRFNFLQNGSYAVIQTIDDLDEYDEGNIIPIASVEIVREYTSQGEETYIKDYIEQENCQGFPDFQECKTKTDTLQAEWDVLTSVCDTKLLTEIPLKFKLIETKLNLEVMELSIDNEKLNETWSNNEYVIGVLFLLGFVMIVYIVYTSLYSPSKQIINI